MILRLGPQPDSALEAAANFYSSVMPEIERMLGDRTGDQLAIVFPPATFDHHGWRLSTIQDLARSAAPFRVNAVVGDDEEAIARAVEYLEVAPGVTGQLFAVDGKSGEID